jgi:hypothetical protein
MSIEQVAPIEQHGTQFVYMPTWDTRRPTGAPGEDASEKRKAEFVRTYGTHDGGGQGIETQGFYMQGGAPIPYDRSIPLGRFFETRHTPNLARVHYTDQPAQAMMHSAAVVKYAGTTQGFGGYIGAAYDGYGGYMVELTPREQWVSFAPYYASTHPPGMEHYINVVTDTNNMNNVFMKNGGQFLFQRRIEGTDLIWGSMSVQAGIDNLALEGRNGAKFAGFVYGGMAKGGHEEYRPGRTKGQEENPPTGINGGEENPDLLHPSEYEEYLSIAYGYPLAPSRLVVGPGDSLGIKSIPDCEGLTIEIESLNENPVGLRSIRLDQPVNAKIFSQNPFPITGAIKATVVIRPVNPQQDASATIVIKDKTGKITLVPFQYFAERLEFDPTPANFNFGLMTPGEVRRMTITVRNPLGRALVVKGMRLVRSNVAFKITDPTSFPFTMDAGATRQLTVEAIPPRPDEVYVDSVEIELACTKWKIPVFAETTNPCVYVDDLDFGVLAVGEQRFLPLRISNNRGGVVTFNNPSGGQVVEWLLTNFTVSPADIQRVKDARLGQGDYIEITVGFSSPVVGDFRTTARFWSSTRNCRDTSVWIARVTAPGPQITPYDWDEQWVITGGCTKNTATEYVSRVFVFNTGDADFIVRRVYLEGQDAVDGYFTLGTTDPQVRPGDRIRPTVGTDTNKYFQTVVFIPGIQERIYTADIVLETEDNRTVRATLRGVGIESHIQPPAMSTFGRHLFVPGTTEQINTITVPTVGTRDVTITDIQIVPHNPASAGQFTILNLPALLTTHPKNGSFDVQVAYRPTVAGDHGATLRYFGDFSRCDVDTTSLFGQAYTLSARPHATAYGTVMTCFDSLSYVYLENDGSDPIILTDIIHNHGAEFDVTRPTFPITVNPGERLPIAVRYMPTLAGTHNGSIEFVVRDVTGSEPVLFNGQPVIATFSGVGATATGHAHIPETYKGLPGKKHDIEVIMDDAIPQARIDSLSFSLRYKHGMMQHELDFNNLQAVVNGTQLQGWQVTADPLPKIDNVDPTVTVLYLQLKAPAGDFLKSPGTVLRIPFVTFIGDTTASALPFFLEPASRFACANIVTDPGLAALDSVCGLNFRLISAFPNASYALRQNSPNPFNPTTDITFSIGLDAQTSVKVYDAKGAQVATLVDTYLQPGEYTVTWDASSMPSGLYYYRIVSGHWSQTQSMTLQK